MNLFHHLSPDDFFRLIREKLETDPFSAELGILLEACLEFDLLRPSSLLSRIAPTSKAAVKNLLRLLARPVSSCSREALSEQAHQILKSWVSLLYVDGGFKSNGRSAWAIYDFKCDRVSSGRGHCRNSTEAEWKAVLKGCEYAAELSESLIVIYTDSRSILELLERVDAQTEAAKRDFAWQKYRNPWLLELCDYREVYPIELVWANRQDPGIARADQGCDRVLGGKRKSH